MKHLLNICILILLLILSSLTSVSPWHSGRKATKSLSRRSQSNDGPSSIKLSYFYGKQTHSPFITIPQYRPRNSSKTAGDIEAETYDVHSPLTKVTHRESNGDHKYNGMRGNTDMDKKIVKHLRFRRTAQISEAPIELKCGDTCICYRPNEPNSDEVYRVVCNNTLKQTVSLTSLVFDNEGPPSRALRVYVRVQDVSALVISAGFISRWMAYTSSVMDLWRAGDVVMPRGPIVPAPTNATVMIYAGFGIKSSHVSGFPSGIFSGKREYGILLKNVTMSVLNLHNLVEPRSRKIRYLQIHDSILGSVRGNGNSHDDQKKCEIKLSRSLPNQIVQGGILINNSKIGIIEPCSLSFKGSSDTDFKIQGSEIGFVKNNGIELKNLRNVVIGNSSLNLEEETSLSIGEKISIHATGNRIVLPRHILNLVNCKENDITDNKFIIFRDISRNSEIKSVSRNIVAANHSEDSSQLAPFVHSSCIDKNTILNVQQKMIPNDGIEETTTFSSYNSSISELSDSKENILPNSTKQYEQLLMGTNFYQIHEGIFYLVSFGICFLVISVIILVAMLAFRTRREAIANPVSERRPSLMYMTGSSIYGNENMWPTALPSSGL